MDSMKSEKLKARKKRDNLTKNILVHSLTSLTCVLLCSYRFWLPSLIESFVFVSLPQWKPLLVNAKTLFLIANLIVVFLVRDSQFRRASKHLSSSPVVDIYDEYVERSKRLREMHANVGKEELATVVRPEPAENEEGERATVVRPEPAENEEGDKNSDRCVEFEESLAEERAESAADDLPKSEEGGASDELPKEELTRRVEEFIARVNKRRWVESRSIVIPRI